MSSFFRSLLPNRSKHLSNSRPLSPGRSSLNSFHQAQWAAVQRMPSGYMTDTELAAGLRDLEQKNPQVAVLWPTGTPQRLGEGSPFGMSSLSSTDLHILKHHMQSPQIQTVVIPINEGCHWQPVCIKKTGKNWQTHRLVTKADGTCGADTIRQVQLFAESETLQAFEKKGGRVESSVNGILEQQIEEAKLISLTSVSAFDFELSRLADFALQLAEHTDPDTRLCCQANLSQSQQACIRLIGEMSLEERDSCVNRLFDSSLADKDEIQPIIQSYFCLKDPLFFDFHGIVDRLEKKGDLL